MTHRDEKVSHSNANFSEMWLHPDTDPKCVTVERSHIFYIVEDGRKKEYASVIQRRLSPQ